ncbi:MAG TPA: radical SAM protein [Steroidobacteraceae bacterium]|nr:radical SAM protein [Steroidobacteraceae bacterium]
MDTLAQAHAPAVLLVGPYDPHCGEYTFLAPPLGVWRLAGVLQAAGVYTEVFDPNCCAGTPRRALERELSRRRWDVIGISTTGMTLRFDLELAHLARRFAPDALLIAGGMEATFRPERMFELGPFDRVVLGEGERPLLELTDRLRIGAPVSGIAGFAERRPDGGIHRLTQRALSQAELREAIFLTPYERMPYRAYWERLEQAYGVGALPSKAAREASLAEIRSVRLITLNYCPMACSFCSSTNFLHEAQGSIAAVARLEPDECLRMIERIVAAHPTVRTIIFQDDIFVFTKDKRVLPLCDAIVDAKHRGLIPAQLQFISTNRIDAMTTERLSALRRAGFRVLGFGVENFSPQVLREFNKGHIHEYIEPMLTAARQLGITPFLDLILTSPHGKLEDLATTLREAHRWLRAGCEIGMYPYIIPFSGAALARDAALLPHTQFERHRVAGTEIEFEQASKILPIDPIARTAITRIETLFEARLAQLRHIAPHVPSRVRSLIWLQSALPVMAESGYPIADAGELQAQLTAWLPRERLEQARAAAVLA